MKEQNPAIKYGFIGAFILVAIGVLMQLIILSSLKSAAQDADNFPVGRFILFGILSILLVIGTFIFCIIKTIKDYRIINSEYTYRKLVGQGLIVTLILVLVSSGFSYLYNNIIAPEMTEKTIQLSKQLYENMNMPEEQKLRMMERFEKQSPLGQLLRGMGLTLLLGMIITFISASVLNTRNKISNQMH